MNIRVLIVCVAGYAVPAASGADYRDGQFPVESNLRIGVAKVDITPADVAGITVIGHRREVTGVRDPLRAGVLILDDGETKAAIVTLDTIGAWEDMVKLARARIEKETRVPAANIMVAAAHNHSGPGYAENPKWAGELIDKLGTAAKEAAGTMRTVTIGYSEDRIGFGINRRKVIDGRAVVRCPARLRGGTRAARAQHPTRTRRRAGGGHPAARHGRGAVGAPVWVGESNELLAGVSHFVTTFFERARLLAKPARAGDPCSGVATRPRSSRPGGAVCAQMPHPTALRFKQVFLTRDAPTQRQLLSALSDRVGAAVSSSGTACTPSDSAAFNLVRNLTGNMDRRDLNSICCPSAFVWTQLAESDSAALARALASVLIEL
jgi:hypothetical protein